MDVEYFKNLDLSEKPAFFDTVIQKTEKCYKNLLKLYHFVPKRGDGIVTLISKFILPMILARK
jgi:hypothetical protein